MSAARIVLTCGHECPDPEYLRRLDTDWTVVAGGRELSEAVEAAQASSPAPICVVPMTVGRDPGLVADAARALSWSRRKTNSAPVVLARQIGETDHLVGWLRGRAVSASTDTPSADALVIAAPSGDPFEDAELFRIARLVRQFGPIGLVEVALSGGDPDLDGAVDRCRRLGARKPIVLSAWFGTSRVAGRHDVVDGGPLLSDAALRGLVASRVSDALHGLVHGRDGVDDGMDAEHGHGFAHSHGPGEEHGHGHGHGHGH